VGSNYLGHPILGFRGEELEYGWNLLVDTNDLSCYRHKVYESMSPTLTRITRVSVSAIALSSRASGSKPLTAEGINSLLITIDVGVVRRLRE
jgi:hypothetical protein